jgi:hypothetical protein
LTGCPHLASRGPSEENDWLEAGRAQPVADAYFDAALDGWVLSRYADLAAAFHSPDLALIGPTSKRKQPAVDECARLKMRAETTEALSPAALRRWRNEVLFDARARTAGFVFDQPVDLIAEYAEPVCLALALRITHPECDQTALVTALAAQIAAAAEEPCDEQLKGQAKAAREELSRCFAAGPEALRESGFVALSRTLVHLLGNAWFALLRHPQEWQRLHARPALTPRGVEELLRFAGLTRLLFRRAIVDTTVNGVRIWKGERVILRILAANRDPERFPDADALSVTRPSLVQLSLGAGRHKCVGAPLIRVAAVAATLALVERFPSLQLVEPVRWRGGSGYSSPISLPVLCSTASAREGPAKSLSTALAGD